MGGGGDQPSGQRGWAQRGSLLQPRGPARSGSWRLFSAADGIGRQVTHTADVSAFASQTGGRRGCLLTLMHAHTLACTLSLTHTRMHTHTKHIQIHTLETHTHANTLNTFKYTYRLKRIDAQGFRSQKSNCTADTLSICSIMYKADTC